MSWLPPSDGWLSITDTVALSYEIGWLRHRRIFIHQTAWSQTKQSPPQMGWAEAADHAASQAFCSGCFACAAAARSGNCPAVRICSGGRMSIAGLKA